MTSYPVTLFGGPADGRMIRFESRYLRVPIPNTTDSAGPSFYEAKYERCGNVGLYIGGVPEKQLTALVAARELEAKMRQLEDEDADPSE